MEAKLPVGRLIGTAPLLGPLDRSGAVLVSSSSRKTRGRQRSRMIGIDRRAVSDIRTQCSALLKPKFYWALLPHRQYESTISMGNTDPHPPCLRVIQTTRFQMSRTTGSIKPPPPFTPSSSQSVFHCANGGGLGKLHLSIRPSTLFSLQQLSYVRLL